MTPTQRYAGLEKMARAFIEGMGHPESPDTIVSGFVDDAWKQLGPMWKVEYLAAATAALAAWEAHEAECSVSLPAEPTPEMCHAGAMAIVDRGIGDFYGKDAGCYTMSARLNSEEAATVYRAMTAAGNKKAPE